MHEISREQESRQAVVEVTRTYLEMTAPEQFRAVPCDERLRVERVVECAPSFFRYLYREVGRNHYWRDRLGWSDAEISAYLATPGVSLWVGYVGGAPAGYFELHAREDGSTEIVYFGLLPEQVGRGLGKALLAAAIERGWEGGTKRLWLNTCTLDSPAALPNYIARGFRPYHEERYMVTFGEPAM